MASLKKDRISSMTFALRTYQYFFFHYPIVCVVRNTKIQTHTIGCKQAAYGGNETKEKTENVMICSDLNPHIKRFFSIFCSLDMLVDMKDYCFIILYHHIRFAHTQS